MTTTAATEPTQLRVAIVGSGLAGLTAARVLREQHAVTVYERSESAQSTSGAGAAQGGQGLSTTPNAVRLLDTLGFDRARAGSVESRGYRVYDRRGALRQEMDPRMREVFGVPALTHLRADVRAELLRLATAPSAELGVPGEPARLVFGANVVGLDPEAGVLTLADGTRVEADVVIAADGIHSRLREAILETPAHKPKKSGLTCFRSTLTAAAARAARGGTLPGWWTAHYHMLAAGAADDRFILLYPTRGLESMNVSAVFRSRAEAAATTESWNADGDLDEMVEIFHDFDPEVTGLFKVVDEVKMWELQDLDPLPTWHRGRAILIGDAAHAMTPMQGQGANMAIEDGEAFRLLLPAAAVDVPAALRRVDALRRPRVGRVLRSTRDASFGLSAEARLQRLQENARYGGILREAEERGL